MSPRLIVRGPERRDIPDILCALEESREALQTWMDWATPWPLSENPENFVLQSIKDFETGARHLRFECFDRSSGKFLVSLGCTLLDEPGRYFHLSYWARSTETSKGYTTEAVMAFCQYLLDTAEATRIETNCDVTNIASRRVIEKSGFVAEGTKEKTLPLGQVKTELTYAIR